MFWQIVVKLQNFFLLVVTFSANSQYNVHALLTQTKSSKRGLKAVILESKLPNLFFVWCALVLVCANTKFYWLYL